MIIPARYSMTFIDRAAINPVRILLIVVFALSTTACFEDKWTSTTSDDAPTPAQSLIAFDMDGNLEARIRWTTYGVPHIEADNLESLAFGNGYAYARDNYCTLAEQMVKIRSERSRYFGPDQEPGSGDSSHLISDFGYKALGIMEDATLQFEQFSDNTRAILSGFSAGFNQYKNDTGSTNLPAQCASADWLKEISAQELAAYYQSLDLQTTSLQYLDLAWFANPDKGSEYLPYPVNENDAHIGKAADGVEFDEAFIQWPDQPSRALGSNA